MAPYHTGHQPGVASSNRVMIGLTVEQWAGIFTIALGAPLLGLLWYVWEQRAKLAVGWFIVTVVGVMCWSFVYGTSLLVVDPAISRGLVGVSYLLAGIAILAWIVLTYEYALGTRLPRYWFGILLVPTLVEQLLFWVPATRHLVVHPSSSLDDAGVFHAEPGVYYLAVLGYYVILYSGVFGMVVAEWVQSSGRRRHQSGLILVAKLVFGTTTVLIFTDLVAPFHPLSVSVLVGGAIIAYALVEFRLFAVMPVGLETTVREMDDAVIIVDAESRLADANPAARERFGLSQSAIGNPVAEALAPFPSLRRALEAAPPPRGEKLSLVIDDVSRHFVAEGVVISLAGRQEGRREGRVLSLREVTPLIQRERELDLIKQVFTRVFRHNVRNEMTVLQGYAELVLESSDDKVQSYVREVLDTSHRILDHSEKAQIIEQVVDDDRTKAIDLSATVRRIVDETIRTHPDVSMQLSLPATMWVSAHPEIQSAVQELVDNAIVHASPGTQSIIEIWPSVDEETVELFVEDNAGGISQQEIEVLEAGAETGLKHGRGVGLWLVKYVVDSSGGVFELEHTGAGTRATIGLERVAARTDS